MTVTVTGSPSFFPDALFPEAEQNLGDETSSPLFFPDAEQNGKRQQRQDEELSSLRETLSTVQASLARQEAAIARQEEQAGVGDIGGGRGGGVGGGVLDGLRQEMESTLRTAVEEQRAILEDHNVLLGRVHRAILQREVRCGPGPVWSTVLYAVTVLPCWVSL